MGSFGERLRREREMRGISLEEISAATKIGTRSLRALEDEQFQKLPGGIFNKGFVRAYAKFLGISEEQAVADYMSAVGEQEAPNEHVIESIAAESERRADEKRRVESLNSSERRSKALWTSVAILILVAAAVYGARHLQERRSAIQPSVQVSTETLPTTSAEMQASPSQPNTPVSDASATPMIQTQPETTAPAAPPSTVPAVAEQNPVESSALRAEPVAAPTEGFVVTLRMHQDCWVSANADGKQLLNGVIPASSERRLRATGKLTLKVGNAGGVDVLFNGQPQSTLGAAGQTRTVVFTPTGMQQ